VGPTTLHHRLRAAAADRSYRELGDLTATHPETVRRYMQGAAPSVEFLSAFAGALGVSVEWLLTGAGAMRSKDLRPHVLREASVTELLNAMAQTIERLIMRVERLEAYMQTLETRIRANASDASTPLDSRDATRSLIQTIEGGSAPINTANNGSANHALIAPERATRSLAPAPSPTAPSLVDGTPDQRARSIADALPQRARPDAGGTPPPGGP
jgi:transcriptional regulator with XRE-family HTH domain